ncbi:MAG: serine/threonine protein kinase [Chloroflexi bacterium]|nr:serine/threonine protein kinase [Chloroflexota bacterium]
MSQLWTGQRIGPYEIVDVIGQGGMATVYRARQPSLDRLVALKVLAPDLARDPDFVARFQLEATIAAKLDHPHIVPIYDVGAADGHYFIAMRLVPGAPLERIVAKDGPLPLARVVAVLSQVASALDHAHGLGVVHRDLKSANILVEAGDRGSLVDFGIARAGEFGRYTRGRIIGTPEYMAPEQAQGIEVDYRADIYALGIIAYELLTGQVPFRADSMVAVLHRQVYDPPPPIRTIRPDLPAATEGAILRALAKHPAGRPPGAGAFVATLAAPAVTEAFVPPAMPPPEPAPRTPTPPGLPRQPTPPPTPRPLTPPPAPRSPRPSRTPVPARPRSLPRVLLPVAAAVATMVVVAVLLALPRPSSGPVDAAAKAEATVNATPAAEANTTPTPTQELALPSAAPAQQQLAADARPTAAPAPAQPQPDQTATAGAERDAAAVSSLQTATARGIATFQAVRTATAEVQPDRTATVRAGETAVAERRATATALVLQTATARGTATVQAIRTSTAVAAAATTAQAQITATARALATARAPTPTPAPGTVLLADNFDDPSRGVLPRSSSDPGRFTAGYEGGEYALKITPETDSDIRVRPSGTYSDVSIAVDVRVVGNADGQYVNVTCRDQGTGNQRRHYDLTVAPFDGIWNLSRWNGDRWFPLGSVWTSPAVRRGNDRNHLELTCAGTTISASINGTVVVSVQDSSSPGNTGGAVRGLYNNSVVVSVQDSSSPGGWVAIGAGSFSGFKGAVDVRFDNLVVTKR